MQIKHEEFHLIGKSSKIFMLFRLYLPEWETENNKSHWIYSKHHSKHRSFHCKIHAGIKNEKKNSDEITSHFTV